MCESCVGTVCDQGCPFYEEKRAATVCSCCGEPIPAGEGWYAGPDGALCERCVSFLSVDDLIDLGGLGSRRELLALLGYGRQGA